MPAQVIFQDLVTQEQPEQVDLVSDDDGTALVEMIKATENRRAPCAELRRVDAGTRAPPGRRTVEANVSAEHEERAAAAAGVVAAVVGGGAQHQRGGPRGGFETGQLVPVAGDGVPDEEGAGVVRHVSPLEEHAAVAAVEDQPRAVVHRECSPGGCGHRGGGGRGARSRCRGWDWDEARDGPGVGLGVGGAEVEDAEQRWGSVDARIEAEEVGVREDAAPLLAHERGADQVRWLFRREAEEHVYDGVVDQLRRRPCAWRRHAWNLAFWRQGLVDT